MPGISSLWDQRVRNSDHTVKQGSDKQTDLFIDFLSPKMFSET